VQHNVLRNTYWLLALSMVPTVFGGAGVSCTCRWRPDGDPVPGGGLRLHLGHREEQGFRRGRGPAAGLHLLHGSDADAAAVAHPRFLERRLPDHAPRLGTAAVFAVLASVATVSKRDFSGMGTWLFAGVVILLLASIANIFLHIPALSIVTGGDCHLLGLHPV
jgi:hypothetical protein